MDVLEGYILAIFIALFLLYSISDISPGCDKSSPPIAPIAPIAVSICSQSSKCCRPGIPQHELAPISSLETFNGVPVQDVRFNHIPWAYAYGGYPYGSKNRPWWSSHDCTIC